MKSIPFLLYLLFLAASGLSSGASLARRQRVAELPPEKTFRVTGYVLDAVTCKPAAGVEVKFQGVGVHSIMLGSTVPRTDANGYFVMRLPVSNRDKGGHLWAYTLLYGGQVSLPADTTQSVTLLLKRNAYRFRPYGCYPLADTVRNSPYAASPILGYPGSQFAFLMRDTLLQQAQKLRAVTFRIGGYDGIAPETFRLRIYQYNGRLDSPPGDDILLENFNISPSASETGFLTYDVSAYNIIVPGNGFFLAIEYFLGDIHGLAYPLVDYKSTGSILRPPCARADIRTWEYIIGKGWHRATNAENCWPLYESALSVEVEPAPKQPTGR